MVLGNNRWADRMTLQDLENKNFNCVIRSVCWFFVLLVGVALQSLFLAILFLILSFNEVRIGLWISKTLDNYNGVANNLPPIVLTNFD